MVQTNKIQVVQHQGVYGTYMGGQAEYVTYDDDDYFDFIKMGTVKTVA